MLGWKIGLFKFTFDMCKTNAMHCRCSFVIFILDELFSEEDYKKKE